MIDPHADPPPTPSESGPSEFGPDLLRSLDDLTADARRDLDDWLALHRLERKPRRGSPRDDREAERLVRLRERGHVDEETRRRPLGPDRTEWRLTASGRALLERHRIELETLHAGIGSAIEASADELRQRGIDPRVLLLERMILVHGRFDREKDGFFSDCRGLARHVREFSATDGGGGEFDFLGGWFVKELLD